MKSYGQQLADQSKSLVRYQRDTEDFEWTVTQDNGVNRRIVHASPHTVIGRYEVVTWPGALWIGGDLPGGSGYLFKRLPDMFEFFRETRSRIYDDSVNLDYWHEKLHAGRDSAKEYSPEALQRYVIERVGELHEHPTTQESVEQAKKVQALYREWRDRDELDHSYEARTFLQELENEGLDADTFEVDLEEYTQGFTWACFAVVHAVREWDYRVKEAGWLARRMRDPRGFLGLRKGSLEGRTWI